MKRVPAPRVESRSMRPPARSTIAVDDREPEACALALALGGEERVERVRRDVGRHALPRVLDGQPHAGVDDIGADRQLAAGGHRVAGVEREVEQDLLDAPAPQRDRRRLAHEDHAQVDELARRAPQQRLRALDRAVDVAGLRVVLGPTAEDEHLARQLRPALGRRHDLARLGAQVRAVGEPAVEQPRVAADHRQQVVEVVRHAARELSEPV